MSAEQVEKVHQAAIAIHGEGQTARNIAAIEQSYLAHLEAEGLADTETTREAFRVGRERFWCDAWQQARRKQLRD